jgi:hypothetical protein
MRFRRETSQFRITIAMVPYDWRRPAFQAAIGILGLLANDFPKDSGCGKLILSQSEESEYSDEVEAMSAGIFDRNERVLSAMKANR